MSAKIAVHDLTGEKGNRAQRLVDAFRAKQITAERLERLKAFNHEVLLCHSSDVTNVTQVLPPHQDCLVLVYTGGLNRNQDDVIGNAVVRSRGLADVEQLINWSRANWDLAAWKVASEPGAHAIRERAFTVIGTLATCASIQVAFPEVQARQAMWQTDPSRWAGALANFPLLSLIQIADENGKVKILELFKWVRGQVASPPDFEQVLREASELA